MPQLNYGTNAAKVRGQIQNYGPYSVISLPNKVVLAGFNIACAESPSAAEYSFRIDTPEGSWTHAFTADGTDSELIDDLIATYDAYDNGAGDVYYFVDNDEDMDVVFKNPFAENTVTLIANPASKLTLTNSAAAATIPVGVAVVWDAEDETVRVPADGDTEADILGVVPMTAGSRILEADFISTGPSGVIPGDMCPIMQWGHMTVEVDAAVALNGDVWIEKGTGEFIASPTWVAEVLTITPTAADATLYTAMVSVFDILTDTLVAQQGLAYLSDADATATEIVTGLTADITSSDVDDYLAATGTATLILTSLAGYRVVFEQTGVGVLAVVETTAASQNAIKLKGTRYQEAGSPLVDIRISRPS